MPCDDCSRAETCPPCVNEPPMTPEEEEEVAEQAAELEEEALNDDWRPPQPERRPPYAVAYSVQGHLYEVALPGDAAVQAVDGALVISHHLGPVAGICQVLPVINEGGAHGADTDGR